ncbi:MAG: ATP-binding protein, partial [Bacteroidota bacterium]
GGVDIYFLVITYLALGNIYLQEGNTEEALRYLKEGHIAANQLRLKPQLLGYERALGLTYAAVGDHEQANRYFAHFAKYVDTLARERQIDVHNETLEKFQAELREGQIARQELLISQQRQQQQLLWFLLAGLGLVAIGGYLVFQSRLQFQRSEARRKETERLAELASVQQAAELGNLRSMIDGQEKERKRVAKDLHDGLGGLLATVKARLSAETSTSPEANRLIDRACTEVRRIAHNMMPQTLALSGLAGSVQDIVAQLNQRGLETELEIVGQPDLRLDDEGQAMLLRIIQELTHNVVKHAEAAKLFIQLLDQPQQLMLTVEDDGKGFNLERHLNKPNGIGLGNIANRVAYLNGTIQYDSSPGHGTTVTLTLPL